MSEGELTSFTVYAHIASVRVMVI